MDIDPSAEIRPDGSIATAQDLLDCPVGTLCSRSVDAEVVSHARLLARLLDTAIQPLIGVDFDARITCVNRAFAELVAASVEELVGRPLPDVTPERWKDGQARALAKVRATGKSLRFEAEILRLDGRVVPIDVAAEPDRDAHGEIVGVFAFVTDLTVRCAAESALRESEERFRKLYDHAPVGYHEVDVEGRIVSINRTECDLLGYDAEELVGRSVFDFVAEDFRERARVAFPEKIAGTRPLRQFERALVTRDGRRLPVVVEERYRRDPSGRIIGLLSTVQDLSERKRAEEALQALERRSRALFEGIDDAVFVHGLDGRILDANPAASRLLGYSHEEFLTLTTAEIDVPEFAADYESRLARQVATGHLNCEGRHRTRDGRIIPVEIHTSTVRFDDRTAVLAVIRDISERLELEETRRVLADEQERNARETAARNAALIRSEARYRNLTEGCLDGVVVADSEGCLMLINPAAARIFGYDPDEVLGRPIGDILPTLEDTVLVGKTVETVGRRKGGEEFPVELSLSAVEVEGDLQFIGSVRDQTERQRMRAMLVQSEKLASIGLLSAGIAHEINNPLAYIGNNLAVLERDLGGVSELIGVYESAHDALATTAPEALARAQALSEALDWPYVRENLPHILARTRDGVRRVAGIVSNLRRFARTAPAKMESVRVCDIVESALEMVRSQLRRHQIAIDVEHGVDVIVCVPTQISQVVLNLLVNASQAIEQSGRTEGGSVLLRSCVEGDSAVLMIADNGPGIPPEAIPKLFDPFYTTKSPGEGTGLGLSICHGIVTAHGGRIEVDSKLGQGSTFRIVLPRSGARTNMPDTAIDRSQGSEPPRR